MRKHTNKAWFVALLLPLCGLLILGTLLWLNPIPADDTATRYAPMAQAFAEGDWLYAFHPHSGVFFPARRVYQFSPQEIPSKYHDNVRKIAHILRCHRALEKGPVF